MNYICRVTLYGASSIANLQAMLSSHAIKDCIKGRGDGKKNYKKLTQIFVCLINL